MYGTELENRVLVKCGGFTSHLATYVGKRIDGDPLWGSRYDYEDPDSVIRTHLDFLDNGAQIILSNTYQCSVEGYMKHLNLDREKSVELICKSVRLAKEARDKYLNKLKSANKKPEPGLPLVLGSIGPYGAMLNDGSEYTGTYAANVTKDQIKNWHRSRIDIILAEGVDGLAIETVPCQIEAEALTEMLINDYPNVKFWISFQCKDDSHLARGESFAAAAQLVWSMIKAGNARQRLFGIGVNCVNPKFVVPLFESLHSALNGNDIPPLLVYSNSGEIYNLDMGEWTGSEKCVPMETYIPDWIRLGTKIIGGCCRVLPKDILAIRKFINNFTQQN